MTLEELLAVVDMASKTALLDPEALARGDINYTPFEQLIENEDILLKNEAILAENEKILAYNQRILDSGSDAELKNIQDIKPLPNP